MIRALLGTWLMLACAGDLPVKEEASPGVADPALEAKQAEALAKYNELRPKARQNAAEQWKLALWCEKNGLEPEAMVHLAAVVRLDPKRSAAWKKLGFKKHGSRWMTDAQIAEEAAQARANRTWSLTLSRWHGQVHGGPDQAAALAALTSIESARAVPAVCREFASRGPIDQGIAVQVLGQIPGKLAARALANLAVYGASEDVRRRATETLRGRDSAEFAGTLIGLLIDPLKYEVRPVGGPGSPGILLVEGERYNVRRYYAPPPPPTYVLQMGDTISYDAYGFPVITRVGAQSVANFMVNPGKIRANQAAAFKGLVGAAMNVPGANTAALSQLAAGANAGAPAASGPSETLYLMPGVAYDLGRNMIQARNAAIAAQSQLQKDVAQIERWNEIRQASNQRVLNALRGATDRDLGEAPDSWRDWWAAALGSPRDPKRPSPKPTAEELVPLAYTPDFSGQLVARLQTKPDN